MLNVELALFTTQESCHQTMEMQKYAANDHLKNNRKVLAMGSER